MTQANSLGDGIVMMLAMWVLSAAGGLALAAFALGTVICSYWIALSCVSRIVPFVDEHGNRLGGGAALHHAHYRLKVWLGHVSFFPYMNDHSWRRILRFHFILLWLIGFGEVFGILLDEGERPLHLSMLMFFLPSLLIYAATIIPSKTSAIRGAPKRQGSGPNMRHRSFTDDEIAERKAAEGRQKLATQRFWEQRRER